jgi:hypothetical protein
MNKNLAAIFKSHRELLQSVFDRSQIIMNMTEIWALIGGAGGLEAFKQSVSKLSHTLKRSPVLQAHMQRYNRFKIRVQWTDPYLRGSNLLPVFPRQLLLSSTYVNQDALLRSHGAGPRA